MAHLETGTAPRRAAGLPRALALVVLSVLAFVALAACSSDDDSVAAPMTSTTTTSRNQGADSTSTSTTTVEDVEAEIVDRYQAFWQARFEANREPVNPDHPGLREYATGAQRENVLEETRARQDEGIAFRLPANSVGESRVRVIEIDGKEATLQECVVNDGVVYEVDTGEVIDDSVVTRNVRATMRRVDSEWKLAAARVVQKWEGVAGCALSDEV